MVDCNCSGAISETIQDVTRGVGVRHSVGEFRDAAAHHILNDILVGLQVRQPDDVDGSDALVTEGGCVVQRPIAKEVRGGARHKEASGADGFSSVELKQNVLEQQSMATIARVSQPG